MGFSNNIEGGIIWRVMKSHAAHIFCHSSIVGRENGDRATVPSDASRDGDFSRGNENLGRSSNHKEYWEALSVHRWIGRRFASVNKV